MVRISSENHVIVMSASNTPCAISKPGETIVFETMDAFGGQIKSENDLFSSVGWDRVNPATGPLFIEGAEPGDCLKVDIVDIRCTGKAKMIISPGFGILEAAGEKSFVFDLSDGKVIFDEKIHLPVNPMIGVIGTAPAGAGIPTGTPGVHGGNMDCTLITKGTVVYLPVNVPGALLAMGDLHAVMGDGEVAVCGAETGGEVTVKVDVIKLFDAPYPMLMTTDQVVTIASAAELGDASKAASGNMREFLVHAAGIEKDKANLLLSLAGNLRICQVVDPLVTVRMEFSKEILKAYGYV